MKYCNHCRQKKLETEFYAYRGYLRGTCKACMNKKAWAVQKRNGGSTPFDRAEYMKRYYQEHKEDFKKNAQKFKDKNPKYFREYYERSKE